MVSALTIDGAGAGAPTIVNAQTGSIISFVVTENRTQNVHVDLFIKEAPDKKVVSESADLILEDVGNPLGDIQHTQLSGAQTWDKNVVPLQRTNDDNLTELPWKSKFVLNWKGVVAGGDGAALAAGQYTLCLNVIDGDSKNNSSQAPDLCDTSVTRCGSVDPFLVDA